MNLKKILNIFTLFIKKSEFNQNISLLIFGQIISQSFVFLASFLITRLYKPETIGVYSLFIGITTILTIIASGSYETAIIVENDNKKSKYLWSLSIIISFLFNTFLFIFLFYFSDKILNILNFNALKNLVLLIPPTIFLGTLIRTTQFYYNKSRDYNKINNSDIIKSFFNSGNSIIFGFLKFLNSGLIFSNIIANTISALYLLYNLPISFFKDLKTLFDYKALKSIAIKYKNYFTYYSLSSVLNVIVSNGTPILIVFFFTNEIAGYYFLAEKVISVPIGLIVGSISKVFYESANNLYTTDKIKFLKLVYNIQKKVGLFLLPFLLILSILGPYFFKLFGDGWTFSGEMIKYFSILVLFKNLVSPVGSISNIINRLDILLYFNLSLVLIRIATFYLGSKYLGFEYSLLFSSVLVSLCYVMLDQILKYFIKKEIKNETIF